MSRWLAILGAGVLACGGDSNDPGDTFPDAAGVYEVSGGFDGLSTSIASFDGTLELNQASQESGTLTGSAALVADLNGDIFNLTDDALSGATVSPSGVVTFTMGGAGATWTFSGTLSGNNITGGRHTLSDGIDNLSGNWSASSASGVRASVQAPWRTVADLMAALQVAQTHSH